MFSMKMTLGIMGCYKGGGGSSGGGGGSSGKVSWPSYLQGIHKGLLSHGGSTSLGSGVSAYDGLNDAWDASPYADAIAYDPTSKLSAAQSRLDAFTNFTSDIDPTLFDDYYEQMLTDINDSYTEATLYPNYYAQALAAVEGAFGTDYVNALVTAQETRMIGPTMRSIARMAAGARDINATMSSSFIEQIAYIERTHVQNLSDYSAKAAAETSAQRMAAVTAGVAQVIGLHSQRVGTITGGIAHVIGLLQLRCQQEQTAAQYTIELNRIGLVAQKEFLEGELAIAAKDATWQLDLFAPVSNLLAAIQGGTSAPTVGSVDRSPSSMLGGALGGAASGTLSGAMIGSAIPGIGTVAGAIGGAILGGGSAFL